MQDETMLQAYARSIGWQGVDCVYALPNLRADWTFEMPLSKKMVGDWPRMTTPDCPSVPFHLKNLRVQTLFRCTVSLSHTS